jgi:hypothetical protein
VKHFADFNAAAHKLNNLRDLLRKDAALARRELLKYSSEITMRTQKVKLDGAKPSETELDYTE